MVKIRHQPSAISHQPSAESRKPKAESWPGLVRSGYTLIEMLISVTIFSGLLIIVLGVVATSSSSSAKVSVLREKSQATRTLIDQISNDLRYVDLTANLDADNKGFFIDTSARTSLVMALLLPGADKDIGLVRKEYLIEQFNGHWTLTLREGRDCKRAYFLTFDGPNGCNKKSDKTDLLTSAYSLNQGQLPAQFPSELSGLLVADAKIAEVSPYVSMDLTIKPFDLTENCDQAESGSCYKVSTKINMGGSR
ncbi:MAG: prepilin-type N-terminal cleavage/methylation domain-containing protein [Patescibacteria group bacterium]